MSLMDQLELHRAKGSSLKGLLVAAFLIGLCLGGTLASSWYATRPPLELAEGGVSARSTAIVGVVKQGRGEGRLATLTVELGLGKGRVLISVPPYENEDTQKSARNAKLAAERETGFDLSSADVVFSIEADVEVIAGPSAGGAMGVVLVAAIENREVRRDAIVSATLDGYGRLGPVGEIDVKLRVAEEAGFKVFIVASNQTGVPRAPGIEVRRAKNLHELVELMLV
ncbi:MAG: hypothetical protein QMC89_03900 [Candidatus Hodarchaeaceae archaeon]|nr:hypothetical protein [Candidatus Hodarchaeaceae archaeon]